MIIKSITLHNFMSYADAHVDLRSVSVACLSGQNGAGKSALLDAITWALWEEGRSSSDELVRLGEKEMWVDLVFDYEGRSYRVRRSRLKRSGRGGQRGTSKGTLDFQVLAPIRSLASSRKQTESVGARARRNSEEEISHLRSTPAGAGAIASHPELDESDESTVSFGHWRTLTGSSMRITQQAICDLLKMDHDTFVNSAYLRQGKADEFTTRAPSERKQVLSEILGLSYFDRLQEACRLKARDAKTQIELIQNSLLVLPDLEEQKEQLLHSLESKKGELGRCEIELRSLEESTAHLRDSVQKHHLMKQRKEQAENQLAEMKRDVQAFLMQQIELNNRLTELNGLIEQSTVIKEKFSSFESTKLDIEKLDQKSLEAQSLTEDKLRLQSQLATIRSRLEVELEHLRMGTSKLRQRADVLLDDTRDSDKVTQAFLDFKKLLADEAILAHRQDAYTRLSERSIELQSLVAEEKIRLEAELGQKELALTDLDEMLTSEALLAEQKAMLEDEVKQLDRVESEFELIEEKGIMLKSEIEGVEAKVEEIKRRQDEYREKIRELTEHRHESLCPLCSAPIVDRLAVISKYNLEIDELSQAITRLYNSRQDLEDERNELRMKYMHLKRELAGRKELDKRIGQFNEKQDSIGRARALRVKLFNEIRMLGQRVDDMDFAHIERESLINVKAEIHKLDFDPAIYASLQSQIRARRHIESKHVQLKKDLVELDRIQKELPIGEEKERNLEEELVSESYGVELRDSLKEVKSKIDALNYDRDQHQVLKTQLADLLPYVEQVKVLQRALEQLPQLEQSLRQVNASLDSKQVKLPELEREIRELQGAIEDTADGEHKLADMQETLGRLRSQSQLMAREVAVTESRKEQLDTTLSGLAEKQTVLSALIDEREDHLFLAESFGKKGIQAVIIENAVPEIETEANRILARLSDNKMHIALVTQQKTKAGSVFETLEILIGDEIGTRNYELYSGGEAFKVNFAIRISLSRLLARRAGARLETLIIDEGFGTQDDQSRERLVRSIKGIQSDFKKILVITHISDVREMFPVQIQVQKESGVSRLEVVC